MLLQIADDFIESVVTAACQLARHRKSNTLEVKDVQLHLGESLADISLSCINVQAAPNFTRRVGLVWEWVTQWPESALDPPESLTTHTLHQTETVLSVTFSTKPLATAVTFLLHYHLQSQALTVHHISWIAGTPTGMTFKKNYSQVWKCLRKILKTVKCHGN